nr:hypothetical protein [Micromonospora sp. DSM 115978]
MTDEIKRLLDEELADAEAPPIGDLVTGAVARGRRMRRRRTLLVGSGGTGVAALVVAAILVIGLPGAGTGTHLGGPGGFDGPPPTGSPTAAGDPTATTCPQASPANDAAAPGGPGQNLDVPGLPSTEPPGHSAGRDGVSPHAEPTTGYQALPRRDAVNGVPVPKDRCPPAWESLRLGPPPAATPTATAARPGRIFTNPIPVRPAGVLALLTQLLPAGRTDGYAATETRLQNLAAVRVQVQLDRGAGPATIQLWLHQGEVPGADPPCPAWQRCYRVPGGGQLAVTDNADDCRYHRTVTLHRPDGVVISAVLAGCPIQDDPARPGP